MSKKRKKTRPAPRFFKREHWPKVRAAIIAYFVVFNVLAAVPAPGGVSRAMLEKPVNQAELKRWVTLLRSVGIDTDPKGLGEWYLGFAAGFDSAHAIAMKPIEDWMALTETWQGWRLFGMPDERPFALRVSVRRDGKEEILYQSGDPERRWGASFLEYRRVRALYNPGGSGPTSTYRGFGLRLSERIFEEMPDVDEVILVLLQGHTTLPGEPPDPEVRETYPLHFSRPSA